ncbi:hypothetical protein B0T20DRAFT_395877 [Sordaria brevicollis]|uniref:Uncharacterized protein n=1 Tax=Sordaria brevicollis TaxID=83679 RepID=A0AAE0U6B3_SORBR|nr:hypothetical protein B0T20DRAFT_395877 [Sordaria brevicollis]
MCYVSLWTTTYALDEVWELIQSVLMALKKVIELFIVKPDLYFDEIYTFLADKYNIYVSKETEIGRREEYTKSNTRAKASKGSYNSIFECGRIGTSRSIIVIREKLPIYINKKGGGGIYNYPPRLLNNTITKGIPKPRYL